METAFSPIYHTFLTSAFNTRLLVQSFAEFLKEGTSCI
ncbi:BnaA06g13260D [Brassica napus]|uniref:BnaA06g13260D protein n=1 Tax=Brassica napus TaxID=3708 RepID=A0A078GMX8_BRANA|nr:BnaA06g13260D [Brassica napus]